MSGSDMLMAGEIIEEGDAPGLDSLVPINDLAPGSHTYANGSASKPEISELALDRDSSPIYEYLISQSKGSRISQQSALKSVLATSTLGKNLRRCVPEERNQVYEAIWIFPWNKITRPQYKKMIIAQRELELAGNTIQRNMSAVRGVMDLCTEDHYKGTRWEMARENYAQVIKRKGLPKIIRNTGGVTGRALEDSELRALFGACEIREDGEPEHPATMARDKAILSLLFLRAMRVSETRNLKMADYNPRTGSIKIVKGKTSESIRTIEADAAKFHLDQWLELRPQPDRRDQSNSGPIFVRIHYTGEPMLGRRIYDAKCDCGLEFLTVIKQWRTEHGKTRMFRKCPRCKQPRQFSRITTPLQSNSIRQALIKRAKIAEINHVTTHDGRRTAITRQAEIDLVAAQKLAGHATIEQTLKYLRHSKRETAAARMKLFQRQAVVLGLEGPQETDGEELSIAI